MLDTPSENAIQISEDVTTEEPSINPPLSTNDKNMKKIELKNLLETENGHLNKLNSIVLNAIEEEKLLSQKLGELDECSPILSNRLADTVASFGGSWKFIIIFLAAMLLWILGNIALLLKPFDPYPFILLNLILSTVAALQAPIIMMSQNRKEEKDRQRSVNDYMINLKSEVEIRHMHEKLDLLIAEQMRTLFSVQEEQMKQLNEIKLSVSKILRSSITRSSTY